MTAPEPISALLVEDNPGDARLLREALREAKATHVKFTHAETLHDALAHLGRDSFDVMLLDLSLPDVDGLETLRRAHAAAPAIPIVVLTGLNDEALALQAVREGAQDYMVKGDVSGPLLLRAMRYATERRRAVDALQSSEEYFRSLIENALDIITVLDDNGIIRYSSPSMDRVLGYEPGSLTGRNITSLIHPEDQGVIRNVLQLGAQFPGLTQSLEFRLLHRNGAWRVMEAIGKRFDPAAAVEGFVLNSRDVTERKRAEEALREANETLRAVIETSPLAIYSIDLDGRVKSWNTAAENIFQYTEDEVLNRPLPIILDEEMAEFRARLPEAGRLPSLAGVESRLRRKDSTPVDVSVWNAQLRGADGEVTGIVSVVADNTERKRLESQFRQAQKMDAVGRLAGGIAHDFNNLLTVITGYCQMLVDRLAPDDPFQEDMQQVLRAADRATTLTKQLLAFSRKQIVQPRVVDLNALVADMDHILKRLVGEDIEIVLAPAAVLGKVRVDPGQIEQVIVNLVVNARDAMPKGGKLTIESRNIEIDGSYAEQHLGMEAGSYVMLAVSDTGVGMNNETKSHLFEPFFTTKEKGRGTGLGLSTSYGIVKQNHGHIAFYSELGHGTTFKIFLPRVDAPLEADAQAQPGKGSYRGTETVLVVEDEDGVRKLVVDVLQQQGYTVLAASGGPEAIQLTASLSRHLDLLITDVVMPRMSGRELADRLKESRPGLRVLFVSGYTDTAIVHHGVLDADTNFLHKPFTPDQLSAKVREALQEHPADTAR